MKADKLLFVCLLIFLNNSPSMQNKCENKLKELQASFNTLAQELSDVKQTVKELQDVSNCCNSTKQELSDIKANELPSIKATVQGLEATLENTTTKLQSTYVRWGRRSCGNGSSLLYDGITATNTHLSSGNGNNFLCLSNEPEWNKYTAVSSGEMGKIYGVEYELYTNEPFHSSFKDGDVPCAVCLATRPITVMIPGKVNCSDGWYREYTGYIMSMRNGEKGQFATSEYICVDENIEIVENTPKKNDQEGIIYPVVADCGSIKCLPYYANRQITCVVCSQ